MTTRNEAAAKSRLGLMLLHKGLINQQQLDLALREQAKTGKRLGEIFIEWEVVSKRQLSRALKKQSRYRMVAAFLAMMLGPVSFGAYASATSSSSQSVVESQAELSVKDYQGLPPLEDAEMDSITGQGDATMEEAVRILMGENQSAVSDNNDLGALDDIATILNPLSSMLDSDVTVKGVKYNPNQPRQTVNEDGSIDMTLPSEIEEIAFRNLRVKGSNHHSGFGDIIISGVRFSPESNIRIQIRE